MNCQASRHEKHHLSQVINEQAGMNFLISSILGVEEIKRICPILQWKPHDPLIALESGFNSKPLSLGF
jgi:hypothetical protein